MVVRDTGIFAHGLLDLHHLAWFDGSKNTIFFYDFSDSFGERKLSSPSGSSTSLAFFSSVLDRWLVFT